MESYQGKYKSTITNVIDNIYDDGPINVNQMIDQLYGKHNDSNIINIIEELLSKKLEK